jgi:hypothetical protein
MDIAFSSSSSSSSSFFFLVFFFWHYRPWWALEFSKIVLNCSQSCDLRLQFLMPMFFRSSSTDSSHLKLDFPTRPVPSGLSKLDIASTKINFSPIPVAARCKTWVYSQSLVGIVGSNPAGSMDVSFLWVVCCQVQRSLRWADCTSRSVLPSVVCLNLIVKPR